MRKACLSMLFAVMATLLCVAYENDGPGYDPKAPKRAVRLMSASDSFKPPESSDICFVVTEGGDIGKTKGQGETITIPLDIPRYFGNKNKLLKSGALSERAVLTMIVYDVDSKYPSNPEVDKVYLNGKKFLGTMWGDNEVYYQNQFIINTKDLNLAEFLGGTGHNTIDIKVDVNNGGWITHVKWISLYIPAAPPVILAHGINSSGAQLARLADEIEDQTGLPTYHYLNFNNHGNDQIGKFSELSSIIQSYKRTCGVDHVNIVAHSMGGLRARGYTENAKDVLRVLQIATPNRGSPVADAVITWKNNVEELLSKLNKTSDSYLRASQRARSAITRFSQECLNLELDPWEDPAIVCLQTKFMNDYNTRHPLNKNVEYGVVAGRVTKVSNANMVKWGLWAVREHQAVVNHFLQEKLTEYANGDMMMGATLSMWLRENIGELANRIVQNSDYIVPVDSAHHMVSPLNGSPVEGEFSKAWHSGLIEGGVSQVVKLMKEKLVIKKTNASGLTDAGKQNTDNARKTNVALLEASRDSADYEDQGIDTKFGMVTDGEKTTMDFSIVEGNHALVMLAIQGGEVESNGFRLKSPSGKVYSDCADNVLISNAVDNVIVLLPNPEKGRWTCELTPKFKANGDVGFWMANAYEADNGVMFKPVLKGNNIAVGGTFELLVHATVGDMAVSGEVKVMVRMPDGNFSTCSLESSGSGLFSCKIPATMAGEYSFSTTLEASSPASFSRTGILRGVAYDSTSKFTGTATSSAYDVDNNGLYDNLTVNFAVNATKAGTYRVLATLADTDGNKIAEGWTGNIICSAGTQTFPVAFDGRAIYGNGECGGYKISSAKLLEIGEDYEAVVDERNDLFTTTAYTYRQFEHDLVTMKTGGSDSAVDSNGDGVYDRLNVTIPLYADDLVAGTYEWSASLMDADGILLGTAAGSVTFVAGQGGASISMSFDRDGIVATHKNGSYYVKNLILWGNGHNFTVSGEYVTIPYNIEDFGGELATVDLGFYSPAGWSDSLVISTNATDKASLASIDEGDTVYLNYAFANVANQSAVGNFVNRFTLSNGNGYSDSWVGYTLDGGKWGWLGEGVAPTMLQNLSPGTYTLTCELDADGQLPETDEYNNFIETTFVVNETTRPNLKIEDATVSKTSITLSESAVVHWRIANNGASAANKTQTAFEIWKYDSSADDWILKKTEWLVCNPLAAGAGRECTRAFAGKTFGVGDYIIRVWADGKHAVPEKNESDNYALTYTITVSKDNATRSSSGVDWQFHKMKGEPDSFYLSTSAKAKKKATTFKVGQTIYMRCCWWNATKKAASGDMRVRVLLNGRPGVYSDRSYFTKNTWYYLSNRTPDFIQNLPAGKYTLTAVLDSENNYVEKNEKNNIRQISFTVVDAPTIYSEETFTCALNESVSWPVSSEGSTTVKGLPPGMKYSGGAILGKATKTGTFTAKFTAKNAVGTRTKTVKIVVVNPGFDVSVNVRANGATGDVSVAAGETIPMFAGVTQNIAVGSTPGKEGIAKSGASSVSATGLPPGLKYAKGAITGVPSKTGTYTVKLVFKNALGWSKTFTMKMKVTALPVFARGTFNGWSYYLDDGVDSGVVYVRKMTVSVTSAGKISATVGSLRFSGTGWTVDDDGTYVATMRAVRTTGSGKSKKTYTDVLALTLDPEKGWMEDQLAGNVGTFSGSVPLAEALAGLATGETPVNGQDARSPSNADTFVSARRNPFGDNAEAKDLAAELAALGTQKWTDAEGLVWNLKVSTNGVATIARTIGSGKNKKTISATAVVAWNGGENVPYVVFQVDGKIVEVDLGQLP